AKVAANQATKQTEMEAILNEFVLQYEEKELTKQN
ncbi:dihydrouridine synthase family protein, partial [Listeria seeligeri FSL N1-067]